MTMENRPCKKDLMHWINLVSFAQDDTKLFLDTHPCDEEALAFFEKCRKERTAALAKYAEYYGPLTVDTADVMECGRWNWINDPWPWQEGGC